MRIRSLLLAGSLFAFTMSQSALAEPTADGAGLVMAQAEAECPQGADCPPPKKQKKQQAPSEEPKAKKSSKKEQPASEEPKAKKSAKKKEPPASDAPRAKKKEPASDEAKARKPAKKKQPPSEEPEAKKSAKKKQPPSGEAEAAKPRKKEPPASEKTTAKKATRKDRPGSKEPALEAPAPKEPESGDAELQGEEGTPEGTLERAERRQKELRKGKQPPDAQAGARQLAGEPPARIEEVIPKDGSTTEKQLKAQGDEKGAERVRGLRKKLLEKRRVADKAAEAETRRDRNRGWWEGGRGRVVERRGDRIVIDIGDGRIVVRSIVPDEGERLLHRARDVDVDHLRGGRTRTTVYRENGWRIVTIRDRYGDIVRRIKITPDGHEIVLIDNRYRRGRPILLLPPLVVGIPHEQYIVDYGHASYDDIHGALLAPPVQPIERAYTLDEVTENQALRAYVPRIDLDTITFEFGSATIEASQMERLAALGQAMQQVLAEHPDEVYLIEGHTDAVGADTDNLILSDQRAEAVAVALSQSFDIPPENLVTEGYGEQYPKVDTEGPSRENRRVTVRRITELLSAEAQPGQ